MIHLPSPLELVEWTADRLGGLCDRVVFLGGAVIGFWLTDPASPAPRMTEDVDVAVEIASLSEYHALDRDLRERGFVNAMDGPICRYRHGALVLDVMPSDPGILGFSNPWYPEAIRTSVTRRLATGRTIRLIRPAALIATKAAAFDSPSRENGGDLLASRDFEDIVVLLEGRPEIVQEIRTADGALGAFLRDWFARWMGHPRFEEGVEAHVEDGRARIVVARAMTILNTEIAE